MSDQSDPMAEAYHALGALRYQQDQAKQALQQQIVHIAQRGDELEKQLAEAEQLNDGDAVQRITEEIEDLHRAYALAADELERHDPDGGQAPDEPTSPAQPTAPSTDRGDGERPPSDAEHRTADAEPSTEPGSPTDLTPASGAADSGESDDGEEDRQARS